MYSHVQSTTSGPLKAISKYPLRCRAPNSHSYYSSLLLISRRLARGSLEAGYSYLTALPHSQCSVVSKELGQKQDRVEDGETGEYGSPVYHSSVLRAKGVANVLEWEDTPAVSQDCLISVVGESERVDAHSIPMACQVGIHPPAVSEAGASGRRADDMASFAITGVFAWLFYGDFCNLMQVQRHDEALLSACAAMIQVRIE